jgi:hypothetical protein
MVTRYTLRVTDYDFFFSLRIQVLDKNTQIDEISASILWQKYSIFVVHQVMTLDRVAKYMMRLLNLMRSLRLVLPGCFPSLLLQLECFSGYVVKSLSSIDTHVHFAFLQIKFHFDSHPALSRQDSESLESQLFTRLAEAGVLLCPGWFFPVGEKNITGSKSEGHYRISFSNAEASCFTNHCQIVTIVYDHISLVL